MQFHLRPLFFSSPFAHQGNRMQGSDEIDQFMLHFDGEGHFQCIRFWKTVDPEKQDARKQITDSIARISPVLERDYRNLEKMADNISEVLWHFCNENQ